MCVILICDQIRPTEEMIEQAWDTNKDGAGIAWREDSDEVDDFGVTRKIVCWKKGLDLATVQRLVTELPLPFVVHFRIATVGGARKDLTHPFPIDEQVPELLDGETFGSVLFHNGHWGRWKNEVFDIAKGFRVKVPNGKWSDSRALAWFAAYYGVPALECVEEKIVAFGPDNIEVFNGVSTYGSGTWTDVEGVTCSNTFFKTRGQGGQASHGYVSCGTITMCRERTCTRKDIDGDGYCPDHQHSKPAMLRAKDIERAKEVKPEAKQEQVKQAVLVHTQASGGASAVVPFVPAAGPISLEKYETLYKAGKISKQVLKKARRLFGLAESLPAIVN